MARKFFTPIDLNKNELRQAVVHLLGSDPAGPSEGQIWTNTTSHVLKFYNGTSIIDLTNPLIFNGQNSSYYLARANHAGTQLANTISNFDAAVQANSLNQMAVPTADLYLNSNKITGLASGVDSSDAVTLGQLQAQIQGLSWKNSVRLASTGALNLFSMPSSIDGVTLVSGDRVLLKDQSNGTQNGIYVFGGFGSWNRADDANSAPELVNASVYVAEGTTNAGTAWNQTSDSIVLGTTSLVWVQFAGGAAYTATAPIVLTGTVFSLSYSSRLVVTGGSLDIASNYPGQTSITTLGTISAGTWRGTVVEIAYGGTGATTAAGARSNLGAVGRFYTTIGDGAATSFTITQAFHGLGAIVNIVQVFDATSGAQVEVDVTVNPANGTVTLAFGAAPATDAYRVVIMG